jgi:hypothetical protein
MSPGSCPETSATSCCGSHFVCSCGEVVVEVGIIFFGGKKSRGIFIVGAIGPPYDLRASGASSIGAKLTLYHKQHFLENNSL